METQKEEVRKSPIAMPLSEAIRLGAMLSPQIFGAVAVSDEWWPVLSLQTKCPACLLFGKRRLLVVQVAH
jgi:hypothetical protein